MGEKDGSEKALIAFATLGAIATGSTALAAENIGITLMNRPIPTDSPPIYEQGKVLVPLRSVTEALGAAVDWNQATRTATVRKWSQSTSLTLGQQVVVVIHSIGTISWTKGNH